MVFEIKKTKKVAVVLFNMGTPLSDNLKKKDVFLFLFRLFTDKRILQIPAFYRFLLALYISFKRINDVFRKYSEISHTKNLVDISSSQANELEILLKNFEEYEIKVFIAMRYSKPSLCDIKKSLINYTPDNVIIVPLYPQYSTATTLSFIDQWVEKKVYPIDKCRFICSYHIQKEFILSLVKNIKEKYVQIISETGHRPRILFSAHGIPKKFVESGDPYDMQIKECVSAIINEIQDGEIDYKICYQSKVGKNKWLTPSTLDEMQNSIGIPILLVPISFVSDNIETYHELDIEYASKVDKKLYFRINSQGVDSMYIKSLANIVIGSMNSNKEKRCMSCQLYKMCPRNLYKNIDIISGSIF